MRFAKAHSGFILPFVCILTLCSGIAIAGFMSYGNWVVQMSSTSANKSNCRLAAISAIDQVRGNVYEKFLDYTGNKVLLDTTRSLQWFTSAQAGDDHIGTAQFGDTSDIVRALARNFPDHTFTIRLADKPKIIGTLAHVTILATAKRRDNGIASTIAECLTFGIGRSRVFDHAYFVNNYGWFNGSTITANGDVRANGDMSLSGGPKINGHVYATKAERNKMGFDAPGDVDGIGVFDSETTYRVTQYGVNNRARPLLKTDGDGGYKAPQSAEERIHVDKSLEIKYANKNQKCDSESVDMPWISNLDEYIVYGQSDEQKIYSTLSQGNTYYVDNRPSNKGRENYGYYTGTGPSGNAANPDNFALVLEGTRENPIKLNGPVVVSNDVVIKGYVTGQGTIYSQRNIHIVGNIQYVNPPSWVNKESNENNASKDLLGLAARGNIVLGDPTQSSWLSSTLKNCISTTPYVQKYDCAADESYSSSDTRHYLDADIGYPRRREYSEGTTKYSETQFCGSYTEADGGAKVKETKTEKFHYETQRSGWQTKQVKVVDGYEYTYTKDATRKYYDSVVPAHFLTEKASTITQIDAVMYNNHGIFGNIGTCTINGSLVCRNEGMIFSGSLFLNWDSRLWSGSSESVANKLVGLPVGAVKPHIISIHEVPDEWNTVKTVKEDDR